VNFETYILSCLRSRPEEFEWHRHIFYVAVGLVSESTELVAFIRDSEDDASPIKRQRLLRHVESLEFYRALAYYQLDLRPDQARLPQPVPRRPGSALDAALGLAVHAGRAAALVNRWIFHRQCLDDRTRITMQMFDAYRRVLYQLLSVEPEQIWQSQALGARGQLIPRATQSVTPGEPGDDRQVPLPCLQVTR